jgi:hypothetical protein
MIASISYSEHSEYCLSFWDNICRCKSTANSNIIQYNQYGRKPAKFPDDIVYSFRQTVESHSVTEFKKSSLKFLIYYEAVGESRELAKDILPARVPKKIIFTKQPEVMYHKLRCMKLRPRLSLLKRVMKRFK